MFAGALPEDVVLPAMDAIGIGSYIGWFIAIAVSGVGVGGQALIARAMGGGHKATASSVLGQSIVLAGLWGIVVACGLWVAAWRSLSTFSCSKKLFIPVHPNTCFKYAFL